MSLEVCFPVLLLATLYSRQLITSINGESCKNTDSELTHSKGRRGKPKREKARRRIVTTLFRLWAKEGAHVHIFLYLPKDWIETQK